MRFCVTRSIGFPRIRISPESGAVMFMVIRIVVVLPAPLGPSRPNIEPFGTESERSSTALKRPKLLATWVSSIAGSMGLADYYGFLGAGFRKMPGAGEYPSPCGRGSPLCRSNAFPKTLRGFAKHDEQPEVAEDLAGPGSGRGEPGARVDCVFRGVQLAFIPDR